MVTGSRLRPNIALMDPLRNFIFQLSLSGQVYPLPMTSSPVLHPSPWDMAGRLLKAARRDEQNHTILKENVATLLTQCKPEFLDSLEKLPDDKVIDGLNGIYANCPIHLAQKMSRDLRQKPYDDAAVFSHLEALDGELKSTVASVIEGSQSYPCKFYVCGSLNRGRFGAHSDVDVLCEASPEWMSEQRKKWSVGEENISVQYIDMKEPADRQDFMNAFSPVREITVAEIQSPGFLTSLYRDSLERKGYAIEGGHLKANALAILRDIETPPEASKRIMWSLPMV